MHVWPIIDGTEYRTSDTYELYNPANGEVIGAAGRSDSETVDIAVRKSKEASGEWAKVSVQERSRLLLKLADRIDAEIGNLATIETEDSGKPISQARADVGVCAEYFRFFGKAVSTHYGQQIPIDARTLAYTRNEPFGVVGSIIAWNYPIQLLGRSVSAAIAAGNVCVVKPADETPRSAVAVAQLAVEVGFPKNVLNVVTGIGQETGEYLSRHPDVAFVGFVGSPQTGRRVAENAANRLVPSILELGGKSAHVVFKDADLERASKAIAKGILQNAGQTCSAGSRVLVDAEVEEQLLERIRQIFDETTIGDGMSDPGLGPLISQKQLQRVEDMLSEDHRGTIVTGGSRPTTDDTKDGSYLRPTLVSGVSPTSSIAREEVFGPVLVSMPFGSVEEAVRLANSTDYALLGAVWTKDVTVAHEVANAIEAGQVFINSYGVGGGVGLPFGGWKRSGYGREKGLEALAEFTQSKTIILSH